MRVIALWIPLVVGISMMARAQTPRTISYQGAIADSNGTPVPDGSVSIRVTLYDRESGGTPVFVETQVVPVAKGLFEFVIGGSLPNGIPSTVRFDRPYWVGTSIENGAELVPRTALTAVPYALHAEAVNPVPVVRVSVRASSSPFTASPGQDILEVDVTDGPVVVELPQAGSVPPGKRLVVKNESGDVTVGLEPDYHNVIIRPNPSDFINGDGGEVRITWGSGVGSYQFYSDGVSHWCTY